MTAGPLTAQEAAAQLIDIAGRINRDASTLYTWAARLMVRPDDAKLARKTLGHMRRYCLEHGQSRGDEVEAVRVGLHAATPRPKSEKPSKQATKGPRHPAAVGENIVPLFGRSP